MEDGFIAAESIVSPVYTKDDETQENMKNKEEVSEEDKGDQEKTGGGFISNLISNFVSSEGDDQDNKDDIIEKKDIKTQEKDVEDNKGGGGFINNILSNMISSNPRPVEDNKRKLDQEDFEPTDREKAQKIEDEEGGQGIFNNIISSLFHHSEGNQRGHDDEKGSDEERKDVVNGNKDEAVPSTDEASILIAIARD